jgi:hypothetical protein
MCSLLAPTEFTHKRLTVACSSLVMEAGKLGLGGTGVFPTSPCSSPISSPQSSPQPPSHMPASDDIPIPTLSLPTSLIHRRQMHLTIKTDGRSYLSPAVIGSLDSQTNHLAKFPKNRRAYTLAISKAERESVLTRELQHALSPQTSAIPNLPNHLSIANMRSSLEDIRIQTVPVLKRAFSEPCFHSWDFGYTDDVFAAEYDISPAVTERNAWDEEVQNHGSRPSTPSGDEDLPLGEKKPQDIIFRINDSGLVQFLRVLFYVSKI